MKNPKYIKRNTLAVRLEDADYNTFLKKTGKNYSTTLRKLIQEYNKRENKPEQRNR